MTGQASTVSACEPARWPAGAPAEYLRRLKQPAVEAAALVLILAVGTYLRVASLDFAQFRADDVTLWTIVRDLFQHPRILTRGMPSSFGLPNGPFQGYLLLPGLVTVPSPLGAYVVVALLNVAAVGLFWAFVRKYWGPSLALLGALLYAVNPWAVVFSRRLWGNDLIAPFTILLIWSLGDLARQGRPRDSVLPLIWLAIVIQVYVVALVHLITAALGLGLARRRLRLPSFVGGLALFAALSAPYLLGEVLPGLGTLMRLFRAAETPAVIDLASTSFLFHLVSTEGYQAFANQAGRLVDASSGLPRALSLLTEAFLAIGLGVGAADVARSWRRQTIEQAVPAILALSAVLLPALLLVRHSTPVYPFYFLTGFPMHFLFVALGVRQVWRVVSRAPVGLGLPLRLLPGAIVAAAVVTIVATHLFLAQVFFAVIPEYWPKSDYGLPLHDTLAIAETVRTLANQQGTDRVYIGGSDERDSVLARTVRPDMPGLSLFNSADTFVWPDRSTGPVLYVLSSAEDRVGQVFTNHLGTREIVSLEVPGSGLRYSFFSVAATELGNLFPDATKTSLGVTFDGRVRLESYSVEPELRLGQPQPLVLHWTLLEGASHQIPPYSVYLRLVDQSLKAYQGADFFFYEGVQWQAHEQLLWWRTLPTPASLEPGVYSYLVGLGYAASPTAYHNVPAVDARGGLIGDGVRLGTLIARSPVTARPSHDLSVDFARKVALVGYDLADSGCGPARSLDITLHWQALDRMDRDYTVFVHVLGPDGKIATQHDSQPDAARYPTTAWRPGDTIVDRHRLDLPPSLAPGQYRVAAGLYDLATGERLGGSSFAAVFPLAIRECSP